MKILVIDDDLCVARSLQRVLKCDEVLIETDATDALARVASADMNGAPFDLVLCDLTLRGVSGLDVLTALRDRCEPATFVLMSGYDHIVEAAFVADAVIVKPFHSNEVRSTIAHVLERRARAVTQALRRVPVVGDAQCRQA